MRRTFVALALGALVVAGWPTTPAFAQDTKTARGSVTALAADSISVKVQGVDMKFAVDPKTTVEARGAGTKGKAAERAGMPGPKLSEVVKVGDNVEGYRLAEIADKKVVFTKDAARVEVMLDYFRKVEVGAPRAAPAGQIAPPGAVSVPPRVIPNLPRRGRVPVPGSPTPDS